MWWFRQPLAVLVVVLIAGCGFHPVYAPTGEAEPGVANALEKVQIAPIGNRLGQELRIALLDLLSPTGSEPQPAYRLEVELTETVTKAAYASSGFATRINFRVDAKFSLIDNASGQPVMLGTTLAISSYNLVNADFSNVTAENDARSRAAERLALNIRNRLTAYFAAADRAATAGG